MMGEPEVIVKYSEFRFDAHRLAELGDERPAVAAPKPSTPAPDAPKAAPADPALAAGLLAALGGAGNVKAVAALAGRLRVPRGIRYLIPLDIPVFLTSP